MGYTLDANLKNVGPGALSKAQYEMSNIRISDLPKKLGATEATLIGSFGNPTLSVFTDSVGFSGSIQYKTSDGSTNLASELISPSIKKISTNGPVTTIKVESPLFGTKGTVVLNGSMDKADTGTVHLEGIEDPKPTD